MTDWRGLCEELLRGLDENRHPEVRYPGHLRLVMSSARESLAQPEPEGRPAPAPAGERQAAPVPVSERPWEREGWCDEQGQCWMGDPGGGGFIPSWRLCRPEDAPRMRVSLPFNALPLPSGELGE